MASVTVPNYNIGVVERGPDSEQLLCDHSWPLQVPAPVPHSLKILEVDDCAYDCQSLLQTPSNLTTVLWSDHYIRYPPGDKLEFMRSELRAWFREDEQFWYDALFFTYQGYLHIQHQTLGDVLPKMDAAIIHGMNRLLDLYLTHLTAIYIVPTTYLSHAVTSSLEHNATSSKEHALVGDDPSHTLFVSPIPLSAIEAEGLFQLHCRPTQDWLRDYFLHVFTSFSISSSAARLKRRIEDSCGVYGSAIKVLMFQIKEREVIKWLFQKYFHNNWLKPLSEQVSIQDTGALQLLLDLVTPIRPEDIVGFQVHV